MAFAHALATNSHLRLRCIDLLPLGLTPQQRCEVDDKQERIEALRHRIEANDEAWLAWSEEAAVLSVDELLMGKVIRSDQAEFARKIIAQQLHILLVSGAGPKG